MSLRAIRAKAPSDVVILSALRTPITRARKGKLRETHDHTLLAAVLKGTLDANPNLDPAILDDIHIGTVLSELGGSKAGRMASLHVGIKPSTAFQTINRACASGLAAITSLSHSIQQGMVDVGIAGGMESMTMNYGSRAIPTNLWADLPQSAVGDARDCIMSMGVTAENVSQRYNVTRQEQDNFAVASHHKAYKAQADGLFDAEIVPVHTSWHPDPAAPDCDEAVTVTKDDGIRPTSNATTLGAMKAAFKDGGTVTAGNSSQVSDGAAAALLMRRSVAQELGLSTSIIGSFVGAAVVGCKPDEMGIGPALAIPKLLRQHGLESDDIGVWEINEAFASQAVYCLRELGLDPAKVNPKGGAIALGHPLGATGARQVATLMPELQRRGDELGVVSMCIGTGMGMAALIRRE